MKLAKYTKEYKELKYQYERLSRKYPNMVEPAQGPRRGVRPNDNHFIKLIGKIREEHAAYLRKEKKAEYNEKGKDVRHQLRNKISAAENRLIAKLTDLRKTVQLMQKRDKVPQLAQILDSRVKKQELTLLKKDMMADGGRQDSTSGLSTEDVLMNFFDFS